VNNNNVNTQFHETKEIKMFKKSLLALAITGFVSAASAGTVATLTNGGTTISTEGVALATAPLAFSKAGGNVSNVAATDVTAVYTAGTTVQAGDYLVFTIAGATLDASMTTAGTLHDSAANNVTYAAESTAEATYLTHNVATGEIWFTVVNGLTTGDVVALTGALLDEASFGADAATVTVATRIVDNAGIVPDYDATAATALFTMQSEIAIAIDATDVLDSTIDVNQDRLDLIDATDTFTIDFTQDVADIAAVTLDKQAAGAGAGALMVFNGNNNAWDADADGTLDVVTFAATNTDSVTLNADGTITADDNAQGANVSYVFTVDAGNAAPANSAASALVDGTFTVAASSNYNDGATDGVFSTSVTVGTWDLNGSSFTVPYMPYGANTKPILTLTHTGSTAGELFVSYMMEGSTAWTVYDTNSQMIETGITNLKSTVDAIIAEIVLADPTATAGKLALQITVNAPDAEISGFAAFKVVNDNGESRTTIGAYGQHGNRARGTITDTQSNVSGTIE